MTSERIAGIERYHAADVL